MRISIHQPNFLPWLGYFHKMSQVDCFVLLDSVPFTKGGYQNRTQIKTANGPLWLTIPVLSSGRLGQATNAVQIDPRQQWRRSHLRTIEQAYGKSPCFHSIYPLVVELYALETDNLAEFCILGIRILANAFGITTKVVRASQLSSTGHSSELLKNITQAVNGDEYLSGPSGKEYLDCNIFTSAGLTVSFHRYDHPVYTQLHGDFYKGLSAIDGLFNNVLRP